MAVTWIATVEDRTVAGGKRINRVKLTTSGSGNTYTTGGDAPPSFGDMGFKRNLDYINIFDQSGDGFVYKYDKANNKIMVFNENENATYLQRQQISQIQAATALNSKTLYVEAVGW